MDRKQSTRVNPPPATTDSAFITNSVGELERLIEEAPPLTQHLLKEATQGTEVIGEVRPASEESLAATKEGAEEGPASQVMELEGPSNASPLDRDAQVARAKMDVQFVLSHFEKNSHSPVIIEGISLDYLHAIRQLLKPPFGMLNQSQWGLCKFLYIDLSNTDLVTGQPKSYWLRDLPGSLTGPPQRTRN